MKELQLYLSPGEIDIEPVASTHAKYSPSKLTRILGCPGSVAETEGMIEAESPYAAEGTMLHEVTEILLRHKVYKVPIEWTGQNLDGLSERARFMLSNEQRDAVNDCLDYVFALLASIPEENVFNEGIEVQVYMDDWESEFDCPELRDVYGTLDYRIIIPAARHLYVIDWKYGKGVEVFPETEQLRCYGMAALKNPSYMNKFDTVTIIIGQPRLYMGDLFKVFETTPQELYEWTRDVMVPGLKLIKVRPPILRPSEKACQWCLIKLSCHARRAQAMETAKRVFAVHALIPTEDMSHINEMLELREQGKDLIKMLGDIDKFFYGRLLNNKDVPGFKLVHGRSNRKWKDEDKVRKLLLEEFEEEWEDIHTDPKLKSPNQIGQLLGRKRIKGKDAYFDLIEKPEGAPTIVEDTDKREAIKIASAEEVFADYVGGSDE